MTIKWNKPDTYNAYDINFLCYIDVLEWDSCCGNFRIYKTSDKFFVAKKEIVELEDIFEAVFYEETMVLSGNKEGYSTLEQAKIICEKL